jgi:Ca2+-binding RTX toxin-like protein
MPSRITRGGSDILTGGAGNDTFVFRRGETQGDRVMDFTGAGATDGDHLEFYGFGTGATLARVEMSNSYTIKADADHGGISETFQLADVTNLDLGMGVGHNDVPLFA